MMGIASEQDANINNMIHAALIYKLLQASAHNAYVKVGGHFSRLLSIKSVKKRRCWKGSFRKTKIT